MAEDERTTGSEAMALMMDTAPGCYFFVGSHNSARELDYPRHHPRFDFGEGVPAQDYVLK